MRWGNIHPRAHNFIFLSGEGGGCWDYLLFLMCSHEIPTMFPSSFQHVSQVPNVFLNMFLITPHFISHILCPKLYSCNLYNQSKGGDCNLFILGLPKAWFFVMDQSKIPITKEGKLLILLLLFLFIYLFI
jgi:hypothetical protein